MVPPGALLTRLSSTSSSSIAVIPGPTAAVENRAFQSCLWCASELNSLHLGKGPTLESLRRNHANNVPSTLASCLCGCCRSHLPEFSSAGQSQTRFRYDRQLYRSL